MYDCIVVGFGIAGVAVTRHFHIQNKKVLVIDANKVKASIVAAGMYNPVILKRFSMAWNAHEQLEYAKEFYKNLELELKTSFVEPMEVLRKFNSVKEQNSWFSKLDNPDLNRYMSSDLFKHQIGDIDAPFDYGKLKGTGRILVKNLLNAYVEQLIKESSYIQDDFDHSVLNIENDYIEYKGNKAKCIIFCEGYSLKNNPYFNDLPLMTNKGSYIILECKYLELTCALKSHFFLIPLGNDKYKFGATYEHQFKDVDHDTASKKQLVDELDKLISMPYKLLSQVIGTRPTVIDRRPLLGQHALHKNLYFS